MNGEIQPEEATRESVLSPVDRVSEMLFGLFMALTFVGAVSVAEAVKVRRLPSLIVLLLIGARTGAVFFTVDNASKEADRLLRASTPIAAGIVLHQMALEDGVMKMRAVPSVEVRAGGRLELKPNGYHLMLLDLKQPLKVGEKFPLTLTFEDVGTVLISVWVEEMGAMGGRAPK